MLLMADLHDIDRSIGDKSGEWFVRHTRAGRVITASPEAEEAGPSREEAFDPTVFLFDAYPGGIGFSDLLYAEHRRLLESARELLASCPCLHGCPTCVGPTLEVGSRAKEVARAVLERLLERP
jgi:DEAD/DEAH box helicase domain-containing protein